MHSRLLVASLVVPLALALALPASAQAPAGTASVEFRDDGACHVTVAYAWNGFKGRELTAFVGALRSLGAGAELWLFVTVEAQGSGSTSHTFDLTGRGSFVYYGGGRLLDAKGRVLSGSDVRSPTSATLNCT